MAETKHLTRRGWLQRDLCNGAGSARVSTAGAVGMLGPGDLQSWLWHHRGLAGDYTERR